MLEKYLLPINERQEPVEFADQQLKVFWLPDEIKVEKDIQDVLVNFTPAEKHAVITTLKLFSIYETHAGSEYWGGRFKNMFNGAEFHRMASVFSMFELAVHAPFYNKINQLLHIDTPEFYTSYLNDPVLNQRVEHIGEIIDHPDDLISLAAFSMVEGVILYSSFAFLKHYQSQGKNKLMNIVRGINFSVRDENMHSTGGAWAFKYKLEQLKQELSPEAFELHKLAIEAQVRLVAQKLYEHECQIIAKLFEQGEIKGITAHQLENFVQSRVNECLKQLGFAKEYDVKYNPVSEWFYKGINNYQFNDFFSGQGREYNRNWDQSGFVWKKDVQNAE
jgi:ribonucleotide reductase beta subunit family protein with ferritin-like domain